MRILITGAAGAIGSTVAPALHAAGHQIVGFDLSPAPARFSGSWHSGDCAEPDDVRAVFAAEQLDAVLHLAGHPDELNLPGSLSSHLITTAALLDAMVEHDVRRIVYASSNHAVGRTPRNEVGHNELLGIDAHPRPDTFYGVAKVAAEATLSLYADRYAIDAVACRIGSFEPQPRNVRHLATWLSPDDCVRMVITALTAPAPGFAVLYGISANTRAWWDLAPGRALGYEPLDDAERFADLVSTSDGDEFDARHAGGPFASEDFYRSALE